MTEPIPSPPAEPEPEPRPSRQTGRLLGGSLLVLLGVAWLLEALDVVEFPWDVFLPGALILVGAILLLNARTGASQGGLIAVGIVLTVLLFIGTAIEFPFAGGVGERAIAPVTYERADDEFELGIGQLTVDLTGLPAATPGGEPTVVRARVGIGQLVVLVPTGVTVRVDGKAGLGNVKIFGTEEGGIDVDLVVEPPGGVEPVLDLRLSVGIGEVSVSLG